MLTLIYGGQNTTGSSHKQVVEKEAFKKGAIGFLSMIGAIATVSSWWKTQTLSTSVITLKPEHILG